MKTLKLIILTILIVLHSCSCNEIHSDISLDELKDKSEYTGGFKVDCSEFRNHNVEKVLLNGSVNKGDLLDLSESGYFRIEVFWKESEHEFSEVIRIVILDKERGETEWGLKRWTPETVSPDNIGNNNVSLIYASAIPNGINLPIVLIVDGEINSSTLNLKAVAGPDEFNIKRGIGSIQVSTENQSDLTLSIDNLKIDIKPEIFTKEPVILQGTISGEQLFPSGSLISIAEDLTIPSGSTLIIESGSFIMIDPGVNIYNNGTLIFRGDSDNPVTLTCSDPDDLWGGIISKNSGNIITASYSIFSQSGFHTDGIYNYGHAGRQALFYMESGNLLLDHCYMLDNGGQVFYPVNSDLELNDCLVQRAMTGGQINQSQITINNCVFTDFPNDSYIYRDEDNDGLYLMGSDATIKRTMFMYAKDDGLDSGGSGGGTINVTDSWFEAIFHEGAALSSGSDVTKSHHFSRCTFINCGQGLELGYSSPNHHVTVDSCSFVRNGIGIRYGDNYPSQHEGTIKVLNSISIENYERDIWNMVRNSWSADTFRMEFDNVMVSEEIPMYPQLKIYE